MKNLSLVEQIKQMKENKANLSQMKNEELKERKNSEHIQTYENQFNEKKIPEENIEKSPPIKCEIIEEKKQKGFESKKESSQNLFEGLTFCFPVKNKNLTKNRINLLSSTIKKRGGFVIDFQQPENEETYVDYLITDDLIPKQKILEVIENRLQFYQILNVSFIEECLRGSRRMEEIDINNYFTPNEQVFLENFDYDKEIQEDIYDSKKEEDDVGKQDQFNEKNPGAFACNRKIAQQLQKLQNLYEKTDKKRASIYRYLAYRIKNYKQEIKTEQDVAELLKKRVVGIKTAIKIKQFLKTGSIDRINGLAANEQNKVCEKLQKIWGIGPSKARDLYGKGIKSIQDLRTAVEKKEIELTKNQKIGLMYYEDLCQRIPRQKVTKMFEFVKDTLFQMTGREDLYQIEVCGSYRRGKQTCGDIDIIITRMDDIFEKKLVEELVQELHDREFLTDDLAFPRHVDPNSSISYMGICQFYDETHHRIDIKYYPQDQYAFAVLYFTGSDMFNRWMRCCAMKKGYCLSDHGMHRADKIGGKTVTFGEKIVCLKEEDIFKFLQLDYAHPSGRSY